MIRYVFKLFLFYFLVKQMEEDCIFCKIAKGEIPSEKIFEDGDFLAIMDAFPVIDNQVLIFPKKHIEPYVFDLENNSYCNLLIFAKKIVKAIDASLKPIKTGMIIEGLEMDHIHVKLFPLQDKKGFKMKLLDPKPSEEQIKKTAEKIRNSLK